MEAGRWSKIEKVLQSVLDRPREGRQAFLTEVCGGDAALQAEVQDLLNASDQDDDFLEVPALDLAARSMAERKNKLLTGTMMGPYRILKPIGAGGMGEVFLAQDNRLGRQIALKILPAEFAFDADRVRRFELEARATSALNHPNVLVVYDIGVHDGLPYIASEYLEGETLRNRLSRASLPVAKAIDFAIQIARGLAAAHENGIIHRDLKPENILITSEGRIKILDFGLAKFSETVAPDKATQLAGTQPGVVMGTVGYISPEQIRGEEAGPTSDIFSFGCVLYEMLAGRRAFLEETNAETIAEVLRDEPPPLPKRPDLPSALIRTLTHCLEKAPDDRFQSARDLAFTLEGAWSQEDELPAAGGKHGRTGWTIAAAVVALTLAGIVFFPFRKPADSAATVTRFEIGIPGEPVTGSPAISISPDGRYVAFLAMGGKGRPIIWTRAMDSETPVAVAGSEDAQYPFWSADSRYLAYHAGDKLKALEISTGGQRTICTLRGTVNGSWSADGVILLSTGSGPLMRVQADGEHLVALTTLNAADGQRGHWWPCFLPDNRHFLYTINASSLENSGVVVGSLDGSAARSLIPGIITNTTYLASGYLLYSRDSNLFARPFNPSRLEFTGAEIPVIEKLKAYYGYTAFAASQTGTLVYRTGSEGRFKLAWFDRSGRQVEARGNGSGERKWAEGILPLAPALSPDGNQLATVQYRAADGGYGIWVSALNGADIEYPVTVTRNAEYPVWSPDGSRIAYSASPSGGARDLFVKRLGEDGMGKLVFHSRSDKWPLDWSSDGGYLLFSMNDAEGRSALWAISMTGNAAPVTIAGTPSDVKEARFSPDGRWLAYTSEQSGTAIVFVQDFPKGESRIPISGRGASNPQWNRNGHELFYVSAGDELVSVPIEYGGSFIAGTPRPLFKSQMVGVNPYAVAPDGQKFLIQIPADHPSGPVIEVSLNWALGLQRGR